MRVESDKLDLLINNLLPYTCPLCKKGQWIVTPDIFFLSEYQSTKFGIGGKAYPVLPIVCDVCGNTIFINAIIANLIDKPSKKSDKKIEEENQ